MSMKPWPASARVITPVDPMPRVHCWECVAKDEQIAEMRVRISVLADENRRLWSELVNAAADVAIAEGPDGA